MSDRKDRECDRAMREEENERRGERERRGEQLREAWRQRHPEREEDKGRPKKGGGGVNGQDRERLELERAGWERLQHEGETVWRNPVSGLVYPQGIAISMLREGADPDVPFSPEGGA